MTTPPALALTEGLAAQLLRLARHRDRATWERLSATVAPGIFRLAGRMTGDPAAAHDVVQETLLRLYSRAGRFQPPEVGDADLAAERWIKRVAVNTVLMHLRS